MNSVTNGKNAVQEFDKSSGVGGASESCPMDGPINRVCGGVRPLVMFLKIKALHRFLKHLNMLMMSTVYTRAELDYDHVVGPDTVVTPSYNPECVNNMPGTCFPIEIISGE